MQQTTTNDAQEAPSTSTQVMVSEQRERMAAIGVLRDLERQLAMGDRLHEACNRIRAKRPDMAELERDCSQGAEIWKNLNGAVCKLDNDIILQRRSVASLFGDAHVLAGAAADFKAITNCASDETMARYVQDTFHIIESRVQHLKERALGFQCVLDSQWAQVGADAHSFFNTTIAHDALKVRLAEVEANIEAQVRQERHVETKEHALRVAVLDVTRYQGEASSADREINDLHLEIGVLDKALEAVKANPSAKLTIEQQMAQQRAMIKAHSELQIAVLRAELESLMRNVAEVETQLKQYRVGTQRHFMFWQRESVADRITFEFIKEQHQALNRTREICEQRIANLHDHMQERLASLNQKEATLQQTEQGQRDATANRLEDRLNSLRQRVRHAAASFDKALALLRIAETSRDNARLALDAASAEMEQLHNKSTESRAKLDKLTKTFTGSESTAATKLACELLEDIQAIPSIIHANVSVTFVAAVEALEKSAKQGLEIVSQAARKAASPSLADWLNAKDFPQTMIDALQSEGITYSDLPELRPEDLSSLTTIKAFHLRRLTKLIEEIPRQRGQFCVDDARAVQIGRARIVTAFEPLITFMSETKRNSEQQGKKEADTLAIQSRVEMMPEEK